MLCDILTAHVNGKSIATRRPSAAVSVPHMSTLAERIQKRLSALNKSARAASLEAKLSDAFVRNILTGKAQSPQAANLAKLAAALKTSEVWLLRGEGPEEVDDDLRRVPIEESDDLEFVEDEATVAAARRHELKALGPGEVVERNATAGLGYGGQAPPVVVDGQVVDEVRAVWRLPVDFLHTELRARESDVDFVAVQGDSMIPTLLPGDRVLINRQHTAPSDGLFLIHDGIGLAVKRLEVVKGSSPVRIRVKSDNPLHSTDEIEASQLAVLGRVICKVTRL